MEKQGGHSGVFSLSQGPAPSRWAQPWTEQWVTECLQGQPTPQSFTELTWCPQTWPHPLLTPISSECKNRLPFICLPLESSYLAHSHPGLPFPYTKPLSSYANGQVLLIKVPHLRGSWRDNTSWKITETFLCIWILPGLCCWQQTNSGSNPSFLGLFWALDLSGIWWSSWTFSQNNIFKCMK